MGLGFWVWGLGFSDASGALHFSAAMEAACASEKLGVRVSWFPESPIPLKLRNRLGFIGLRVKGLGLYLRL